MTKRLLALVACMAVMCLAVMVRTAAAQDARTVLQAAARTMGADNLKTVQISGTGVTAAVGQSYSPNDDWPRFEVTKYTKTIDYDAKSSREELTRRQGTNPPRGGGGTPLQGEQQQVFIVSGNSAWNMPANNAVPAPAAAEVRQLEIWLTPHGFLKGALAGNPTAITTTVAGPSTPGMTQGGRKATMVSFTALGKYRVNGMINDQNLVEMVQTRIPNPVMGDMLYDLRYTDYKDFAGVKFPTLIHVHQGEPRLNPGHNSSEIKVTNIQANLTVPAVAVPDAVRQATVPAVRVESQKLADGVWLVAGGTHNSVAVDFRDYAVVVEAPLNEDRSLAVIGEVNKLIPNKPIRYVVSTHHHFDHSGGLRTYVAQGATIVTHQGNREFYEQVVFSPAPWTLQPDRLAAFYPYYANNRTPALETVNQKYVLSDGVRTLDLYPVQGLNHASTMLLVYLPKEKILVNADLYSPPAPGAPPPVSNANIVSLNQNIQRLKLDVTQHVPIHGVVGTAADFLKIVGNPSN